METENGKPLNDLQQRVLKYIQEYGSVSFAELARHVEGFKGDYAFYSNKKKNIVLWDGLSEEAGQALEQLINSYKITMKPTMLLVYLIDGMFLGYPIARRVRDYKKPHWLPIVFDPL